jgi:ABC-type branched-subunit amino acid transport system substrate-binding protein
MAAAVAASLTTVAAVAPPTGAQGGGAAASDIGITADEIRIAVVADVDNQLRPGFFAGPADAVRAFAKYVNQDGGIAGRKLVVEFIDSHLNPDDARSAILKACEDDFALVGTAALFVSSVEDMVNCPDKSGAAVGLPDIPVVATGVPHQCAPVSYPVNPAQLDCATKDDHPQTWRANRGPIEYYERTRFDDLHGITVYSNDIQDAAVAGLALGEGAYASGVEDDGESGISALATQAEYGPIIQKLEEVDANFVMAASDYQTAVKVRREAKVQGVDAESIVWNCFSNCYDEKLIEEGGADVEGQYVILNQLPFTEAKQNKQLANYIKYTGRDKVDGFGAYAWISGLLFREAVSSIVERSGENGITRQALLEELSNTHAFDADGMWATTDVGNRVPPGCFLITQVQDGRFKRVYPKKKGTFDCKKGNTIDYEADLLQG